MVITLLMMKIVENMQATSEGLCMESSGHTMCGTPVCQNVPHLLSLPRWFSIVMYLVFLFTVIVVLLNLLIAQMSDTYNKIQGDVEGTFAIARARIIARLQKGKRLLCRGKVRNRYSSLYCIHLAQLHRINGTDLLYIIFSPISSMHHKHSIVALYRIMHTVW